MASQIIYTSTLPPNLMNWLETTAKTRKITKKTIIVDALIRYKDELKRQELAETFQRASKDKELVAMSEEGLEDYLDQLDQK